MRPEPSRRLYWFQNALALYPLAMLDVLYLLYWRLACVIGPNPPVDYDLWPYYREFVPPEAWRDGCASTLKSVVMFVCFPGFMITAFGGWYVQMIRHWRRFTPNQRLRSFAFHVYAWALLLLEPGQIADWFFD
jgi:hypothetical protein